MNDAARSPFVLLALAGATIVFCRGDVFATVRRVWPRFLGCPLCVGFWTGALGMFGVRRSTTALDFLLDGSAVALLALLSDAILCRLLGTPE